MAARDDMVIRPLLRRGRRKSVRDKVRERAQEDRKTQRAQRKQSKILRKARQIQRVRRLTKARKIRAKSLGTAGRGAAGGAMGRIGTLARGAGAVGLLVAALGELVIQGGRAARKFGSGHSERLMDATDADTMYGGLDEEIAADLAAVSFVESNPDLLRIIGRQGKVNSQIADIMHEKRRIALMQMQGADRINRDPDLDAPETIVDMLIAKASKADLKGLADRAGAAVRSKTLKGPIKTGR